MKKIREIISCRWFGRTSAVIALISVLSAAALLFLPDTGYSAYLNTAGYVCEALLIAVCVLRIVAFGRDILRDGWGIAELAVTLLSIVPPLPGIMPAQTLAVIRGISLVRLVWVGRALCQVETVKVFLKWWRQKTTEQKGGAILKFIFFWVKLAAVICLVFAEQLFGEDSHIAGILWGDWEKSINLNSLCACVVLLITVSVASKTINTLLTIILAGVGPRSRTIGKLINSIIKYGMYIAVFAWSCVNFFNIDLASLGTAASVISIVVGLGAQAVINDILSGIFIIIEGEFMVGDIVTIDDYRGIVQEIGIRTTKVMDISGDIKIINNSDVRNIINMTKKFSLAVCDISIDHDEPLETAETALMECFPAIRENLPMIVEGPYYRGVSDVNDSGIILRIVAQCHEMDRVHIQRYMNREFVIALQSKGIKLSNVNVDLKYAGESEEVPDEIHDAAGEFAYDQLGKSRHLEDYDL